MLIIIVILSAVIISFFLAAPKSVKDRWFKRENRVATLSKVLVLVFLLSLLLIYGFSDSAHDSIPAAASIVAFGMMASTSLAGIVYAQTRPLTGRTKKFTIDKDSKGSEAAEPEA